MAFGSIGELNLKGRWCKTACKPLLARATRSNSVIAFAAAQVIMHELNLALRAMFSLQPELQYEALQYCQVMPAHAHTWQFWTPGLSVPQQWAWQLPTLYTYTAQISQEVHQPLAVHTMLCMCCLTVLMNPLGKCRSPEAQREREREPRITSSHLGLM